MAFETTPLGELMGDKGYIRGPFGSALKRGELQESGIPVYEQQHAIDGVRTFRYFVDDDKYSELRRFTVEANDLIISCSGTVGRISVIQADDPKGIISQALLILRPDIEKVLPHYLYYFLTSKAGAQELVNASHGAVQLNIAPRNIVEKIPVPLPANIEIQRQIVQQLKVVDDKIDLNRRINQTLEAMAQAIFKSWFVEFDPVKAKIAAIQEGRDPLHAAMSAISGKSEAELDALSREQYAPLAATAALFPEEMEASELGEIPRGGVVEPLSKMIQLIGGGTPKRSDSSYWGGDVLWYSVKDAPADGDVWVVDTEEKITGLGLQKSSTKLLPVGATIISARGTVGKLALVGKEMAMNQSCYGVTGAGDIGSCFNHFNLKEAVETLKRNTHGAVFDTITQATFETVTCVKPLNEQHEAFERQVRPLLDEIRSRVIQNRTLATLRETLLPKLLSGELSVAAPEAAGAA